MKSFSYQSRSTSSMAALPLTLALNRSGYCVEEWLPQIVMCVTAVIGLPVLFASCVMARLWSRRVIAVNWRGLMSGALRWAISELVLAGLPTTRMRMSRAAAALIALPCTEKIAALASSRSLRSMPGPRGRAPTSSAYCASAKACSALSVHTVPASSGKAQSSSSMATPCRAPSAGVISSMCRITGWSGPSIAPEAIRNSRL